MQGGLYQLSFGTAESPSGILYAELIRKAGIEVVLNETRGTIHGYDIVQRSPITKASLEARIRFMKDRYYGR